METKKSIRDIKTSNQNIISDMVSTQPTATKKRKKVENAPIENSDDSFTPDESVFEDISEPELQQSPKSKKKNASSYKKIVSVLGQIKPSYLIIFGVIILGLILLIFIPSPTANPEEQDRKESEMVKKQFAKHIVLPQNEQIDIRKITNKLEDPFFKDAQVGDYLIIFYKNRIAYIYSIDKDIIINAGVVFIDPKTATTTSTTTNNQ